MARAFRLFHHRVGVEVVVATPGEVFRVRSGKIARTVGRDLHDPRGQFGHEPAVVRHEENRAGVVLQAVDERADGFQVEVVGGLVQHQHVRPLHDEQREDEARGLAAGEQSDPFEHVFARE